MRPLLAMLIVAAVFSVLGLYMRFEASVRSRPQTMLAPRPVSAAGDYSLQIDLTFDAAADPFGLDPSSLVVRLAGEELLRREEPIAAGEPIVVDDVPAVVQGRNEFYVEAAPRQQARSAANALRVRVLRNGVPIDGAETTIWSEPGQTVAGTVIVDVDAPGAHHDHSHD